MPDSELGGEMAIDVHCEAGNILTKGGRKSQSGIFGFPIGEIIGGNKDKHYI